MGPELTPDTIATSGLDGTRLPCGPPGQPTMTDTEFTATVRAAAFLTQALGLPPGTDVTADLATISTTPGRTVYATRVETATGPAAFVVYAYDLATVDASATPPGDFERDLETITRATEDDTPGPRILAHAQDGGHAFILATSPATFRALAGTPGETDPEGDLATLPPGTDRDAARRDAATHLLRLLRQADLHASVWFAAIDGPNGDGADQTDHLDFNDAEAELALFLLDERSIQRLLRLLQVYIAAAKRARA